MYEATVSVVKENSHLLDFVKAQLVPFAREVDGLTTDIEEDKRNYFSLACTDTYRFQAQRRLTESVSHVLSLGYKNVYVRNLLKINENNFYQNVLVNTICLFDNEYDKQIVSRVIDSDSNVYLDGYYNFRLGAIKKKWKEISNLVSDNFYVMTDNTLVIEFLQYLLESTPSRVKQLSVSFDNGSFTLYGSGNKVVAPSVSMARTATCEEEAMLNIVNIKPQLVKVYYKDNLSKDFCDMLNALFQAEYIQVD